MHIIYALLLSLASATTVFAATSLADLSPTAQEEVSKLCLPIQFKEGATAYRNCVQNEITSRSENPQTALAPLSFDDKYAVQQACAKAGAESATAYNRCVAQQVGELQKLPSPILLNVSDDEVYAAQQACFDAQTNQGAAAFRTCMNTQVEQLSQVARVDLSNLSALNKNALQLRCSANASSAANYRQCLSTEYSSIVNQEPRFLPTTNATSTTASETTKPAPVVQETIATTVASTATQANTASAQTEPLATQLESSTNSDIAQNTTPELNTTPTLSTTPELNTTPALSTTPELNTTPALSTTPELSTVTNTTTSDIAAGAAPDSRVISRPELVAELEKQALQTTQALPSTNENTLFEIANTNAVSELSESTTSNTTTSAKQASGFESAIATLQTAWQWLLDQLATLGSKGWLILAAVLALPALLLGSTALARSLKERGNNKRSALAERIEPGLQTRARNLDHSAQLDDLFEDDDFDLAIDSKTPIEYDESEAATQFALKPQHNTTQMDGFDQWFASKDSGTKQQLCLEFLLYWMAYSDNRYAPELKKRLFTTGNLSDSDSIKRWVLMQDVAAFSQVVQHMRDNSTQAQLNQSIDFLMAMLVTENNVTPSQNTLLRFLADAFNLGQEHFQKHFVHAYGHELPSMPRVDRVDWWEKQDTQASLLWNVQSVQELPEKQQLAIRLGLAQDFKENDVIQAFRRAARRCHPDRFSELGEKELAMAEVQFSKFEESRDVLLGVTA